MGHRFEDLFLPHLDAAYTLARFIARDRAAADDIVQESYLRAFRSFQSYRGGDARTWLLAIVRNCSFDWTRSSRRNAPPDQEGELRGAAAGVALEDLPDPQEPGPESAAIRNDEIAEVRAMIGRLPDPFRETLVLRELEELSYRQISEVTGVPVGTVMSRLARARRMLLEEIQPARREIREPSR